MGKGGQSAVASANSHDKANSAEKSKNVSKFTWAEVKEHHHPEDAWIVHSNKVYDVSNWHEHPGGAVIFTHAGDDMTDIFAAFHAPGSHNMLKKFLIGELIPESVLHKDQHQRDFERGYRDLRSKLVMMGMFKSNKLFYVYKFFSNMSLFGAMMPIGTVGFPSFIAVKSYW